MTINFNDSKFDSISKIKQAEENGKKIFNIKEQSIFIDVRVDTVDKARKVAELLVKVKLAQKKTTKDETLTQELEEEAAKNKNQGSVAWQVVNSNNYLAQRALNRLHKLLASEKDEVPATKEARKTKRDEIKVEQNKKKAKLARNKDRQITYRNQLSNLQVEKRVAQKNYARQNNLIIVLKGNGEGEIIKRDGSKVKLSDFSAITKTIKDYSNGNVSRKESDITANKTDSLINLINHANGFLRKLASRKATFEERKTKYIESKSLATDFNGRKWENKHSLASSFDSFGYRYLKVLKDTGADNLSKAVDQRTSLSDSDKKKYKKYAKEITEHISRDWLITGKPDGSASDKEWESSYNAWQANLLKIPYNEYPHVAVPDWEKIFEFMKAVFPPKTISDGSGNVIVNDLEPADCLDKPNHDSYLKPSDGKTGWENLKLSGYAINLPSSASENTLAKYIAKNENKVGFESQLIGQYKAEDIPNNWNFKSLTGLWWKIFYHHMNSPTNIADNSWKSSDITYEEKMQGVSLDQIRYVRTMRAVLKEFGISGEIDEFDNYLLQIADEADKKQLVEPRDKILELSQRVWVKDGKIVGGFDESIQNKVIFADDYDWENFADKLLSMADNAYNEVLRIDTEIEQVSKQISGLASDNADLQLEIDSFEEDINFLLSLDEDQEQPLDANKTTFQTVYDEKSKQDGKWNRNQIRRLRSLLELIKTKINDDAAFETEYKTKQEEIEKIYTDSGAHDKALEFSWYNIKREADDSITEAIKKIIKEKDTIATSLEEIEKEFAALNDLIKIDDKEKNAWDEIKKAIGDPTKFQDDPVSTLNEKTLTALFGFTVDKDTKDKWAITLDTIVLTEAIIKKIIGDYAKGKTKFNDLTAHLQEKGDGLNGGNTDNYTGANSDDTKKNEAWEKFIKKGPKVVAETIVNHEFEELKKNATKLQAKKDEIKGKDKIKLEDYSKDGKVDEAGIKKFLYQERIGQAYTQMPIDIPTPDPEKKNNEGKKDAWFWPLHGGWKNWVAWGGTGAVVIGAACIAIFWQNISEWWNGPIEEEGKIGEGEEKENEE